MAYTDIDFPAEYFNTVLWTGTGSAMSITGVGFQPDWVWYKGRSFAYNHGLFDVVRGTSNFLQSNSTDAEQVTSGVTAFDSDGFSLGSDAGGVGSGVTFVGWNWKANGAGVSNTAGSITSTVSANTTSGFSIVSYTGTGANATVGHGLGVAPAMIIVKSRSGVFNWGVYHESIGNTKYLELNDTTATQTSSTFWQDTSPTSSFFSLGSNSTINQSSGTYIAYCFAEKKGFSKFGSYIGNGSTDGTFVYTGFKPAFVLMKRTTTASYSWIINDNKRNIYNPGGLYLQPDTTLTESGPLAIDFLSNGFKQRNNSNTTNASGVVHIYMAFAENPFVTSTSIPTTAR
jgi:hypothetical protein